MKIIALAVLLAPAIALAQLPEKKADKAPLPEKKAEKKAAAPSKPVATVNGVDEASLNRANPTSFRKGSKSGVRGLRLTPDRVSGSG